MDTAWNGAIPFFLLVCVAIYGVIFMVVSVSVPPSQKGTGRSLLLDLAACVFCFFPAAMIFGLAVRLAWNFTVSQPFLIGLGGPAALGLIFGLLFACGRRAATRKASRRRG
ncbi:hypothetical protein DB345_00180 [Spartobacteria bacterium LR76]|nr:hypothetical protein DB345_00180 [Spartobacteria bacterium LR76]